MSAALDGGLDVTALHNHFFYEKPRVFFMHIAGEGLNGTLAAGVGKTFAAVKAVRAASPKTAPGFGAGPIPARSAITPAPLDALFGAKGQTKDGMYKAVIRGGRWRAANTWSW